MRNLILALTILMLLALNLLLAVALSLLLPSSAIAKEIPIDEAYVLVCTNTEGVYFIRPSDIDYALQGLTGVSNCLMARDTEGEKHLLCQRPNSPDTCELSEPGPAI